MIKRQLYGALKNHLSQREISFIVGPRQSGKTTLMLLLKDYVGSLGKKSVLLNLDIEADKQFFTSQESLLRKIRLEIGEDGYVFIDEIQRKEDAGLFLKGIYDMQLPYKFVVSGSGSVELKEKIHESLTGRKRIFELLTLSFGEFVDYKTGYAYESKLEELLSLESVKRQQLLEEYLDFGGYPRVVLADTLEEKRSIIAELYESYLERDVAYLLGVQKTERFTALVRLLASQIGQLISISELSSTLGISTRTVTDYLWYLQKTFILEKVTPFFRNVRKEITKAPVFYFFDCGMRNYALGTFGTSHQRSTAGFIFQNFVFHLLKAKIRETASKIHFWRTTDKAEVDFVVDTSLEIIPVEVKYKNLSVPEMSRSFQNFLSRYKPARGYVVHLGDVREKKIAGSAIQFNPYYKFLFHPL